MTSQPGGRVGRDDERPIRIPRELRDAATRDGRTGWFERLPELVGDAARRWSLEVGEPFEPGGQTAWVAPALTAGGEPRVLKVMWRHTEAEHEADALHEWNGEGAVLLHGVIDVDDTCTMLLERCVPGTMLSDRPESEQDVVVASLLRRLWREPSSGHRFRELEAMCGEWADAFENRRAAEGSTLDAGMAREGMALFRSLPATATEHVLLCTDLHADNVLAAEREPWLAVDPKPYVGDPAYDTLQHMLNCKRLHSDPAALAARMAELLELDQERVRLWLFARCVQEALGWPSLAGVARRLAPG